MYAYTSSKPSLVILLKYSGFLPMFGLHSLTDLERVY